MSPMDPALLPLLSTSALTLSTAGSGRSRVDKTLALVGRPEARHLDVCIDPNPTRTLNCSHCSKCMRTMLTLEIAGQLDEFCPEPFQRGPYLAHRADFLVELLCLRVGAGRRGPGFRRVPWLAVERANACSGGGAESPAGLLARARIWKRALLPRTRSAATGFHRGDRNRRLRALCPWRTPPSASARRYPRCKRAQVRHMAPRPEEWTMFERFTDRARRVVVLAQEEAKMLNHNYIGTEHILLGLIHEGEGVAAKALESLGISLDAVREQVQDIIGQGQQQPTGHIPFTPRAKKVLELSLREALQLGHNYIGTEHILLGLIREGEGVAAQVLVKLGADLNKVRQQVIQLLSGYQGKEPAAVSGAAHDSTRPPRAARRCSTSSAATSRRPRATTSSTR